MTDHRNRYTQLSAELRAHSSVDFLQLDDNVMTSRSVSFMKETE
jgi:hypothetical protein